LVGSGQEPAAYVFDATTGLQLRKLPANDYVRSVDLSAGRAVLGTPSADVPGGIVGMDKGVTTVFNARTGALIKRIDGRLGAFTRSFGREVAIEGNTLAASSGDVTSGQGELHVFDSSTGEPKWTYDYTQNGGTLMARDIAIDGDRLAVGVARNGVAVSEVLIFNSDTGELIERFNTTVNNQPAAFATTIGFSNGRIAVGVWSEEANGIGYYVGAVNLFDATSGLFLGTVENPDPQAGDEFGFGLAMQGRRLVVGAPGDSSNRGIAYSYLIPEPGAAWMAMTLIAVILVAHRSAEKQVRSARMA
jgi:outer membrane protein assembly factor BamB